MNTHDRARWNSFEPSQSNHKHPETGGLFVRLSVAVSDSEIGRARTDYTRQERETTDNDATIAFSFLSIGFVDW
jgi:hypothetical protein